LLNFLKIARLSKVIEESQKIKRENLNFLTNIFGKATTVIKDQKLKKLKPVIKNNLNSKAAAQAKERPKNKLVRLNSKIWNKKKKNQSFKRGFGESPNNRRKISENESALVKPMLTIKNVIVKNKNPSNNLSNKDDNLNEDSDGSYKYNKIFNPTNYQGKSVNYEKLSMTSVINDNKSK